MGIDLERVYPWKGGATFSRLSEVTDWWARELGGTRQSVGRVSGAGGRDGCFGGCGRPCGLPADADRALVAW